MSITSSTSISEPLQVDGRRYIRHFYTFHTGEVLTNGPRLVPGDTDVDADRLSLIPQYEEIMETLEDNTLISKVEDGLIADIPNETPVHPETDTPLERRRRWHRKLVRIAYRNSDIKYVRKMLYQVWYWLKFESGYTPSQIASYLNVTVGKLSEFDDRMQAIHDNLTFVDADTPGDLDG